VLTKSIKEARSTFSQLIDQVQKGETVGITRHGRQAAVLVSAHTATSTLPSLRNFRDKIKSTNRGLSDTVLQLRDEARF